MRTETILMPLINEGTDVWVRVSAVRQLGNAFLVLGPMPEDQVWKFPPDSIVGVKLANDDDLLVTRPVELEVDCRRFNISDRNGNVLCPACGWPGYFHGTSYHVMGGNIATGICPCCRFEPGYDDDPTISEFSQARETILISILAYRKVWIESGMAWRGNPPQIVAPKGWDPREQLQQLIEAAPWIA